MHIKQQNLKLIFIVTLLIHVSIALGQIKIMQKTKPSLSVIRYDSLTNFEEMPYGQNNPNYRDKRTYHHLRGQTVLYCGSDYKQCKYGDYYIIESIVTKNHLPYLQMVNKKTKRKVEITGITYNTQFVVQGHYEKIKRLYVGKRFIYSSNEPISSYYDVNTGNYAKIGEGSVWKCVDVQVENRSDRKLHKYSPLLLIFQSDSYSKKIYCYYEGFYGMEEVGDKKTSDNNVIKQHYDSKYSSGYGASIADCRLEKGMTKGMIESMFSGSTPTNKKTSINISQGKTIKQETWIYKNDFYDHNGKPQTLTLFFEAERLSDWTIE